MIQKIKKQGIVLVTTLLTVVLVVMMVTAVVHSGTAGLALTTNFHDREAALLAAESGLQYATTRLQNEIGWQGGGELESPTTTSDLTVKESNGNVIGILTSKLGQRSMFRIKFNFEDGDEGEDSRKNPKDNYEIPSPFVSFNNIMGDAPIPAYRANSDGQGRSSVTPPYSVPANTALIIVEGIAGPGVRYASFKPVQDEENRGIKPEGYTVTRIVEGYLQLDSTGAFDSAAYAAGDLDATLTDGGKFTVTSEIADSIPRLRSMKNVAINANNGQLIAKNGQIIYGSGQGDASHSCTFNNGTIQDIATETQDSTGKFSKLKWEDISKASEKDTNLPSGTYEWCIEKNKKVLKYYPTVYPLGEEIPASAEGRIVNSDTIAGGSKAIIVDENSLGLLISDNVYVPGSVVIRTNESLSKFRATVGFVPNGDGELASVLTSKADIQIQGGVMGSGSVTTEGSLTFQGPSILESDPDTGVSIYSKGDVTLEAISYTKAGAKSSLMYSKEPVSDKPNKTAEVPNNSIMAQWWEGHIVDSHHHHDDDDDDDEDDDDCEDNVSTNYDEITGGLDADSGTTEVSVDPTTIVVTESDIENGSVPIYSDPRLIKDTEKYQAKKKAQLEKLVKERSQISYADQDITGVIYTWGNLNVNIGEKSFLNLTGTVIAYGANPSTQGPGEVAGKGKITISSSKDVKLAYDPTYIKALLNSSSSFSMKRTLWTSW